jgi:hypothetical protein
MNRPVGFSSTAAANAALANSSVRQIASVSYRVALEPFLDVEIEAGQPVVLWWHRGDCALALRVRKVRL